MWCSPAKLGAGWEADVARVLKLFDPSAVVADVDLLNASGFYVTKIEIDPASEQHITQENPLAGQERVVSITCDLLGSSQDNTAAQYQGLLTILRRAEQFWKTKQVRDPIYLQLQHSTETKPLYAKVKGVVSVSAGNPWDVMFEVSKQLEEVTFHLIVEYPWREQVPGLVPTESTLNSLATRGHNAALIPLPGRRCEAPITHVYNYDASGPTWSGNLYDSVGFNLFAAAPATGDKFYVGWDSRPGDSIVIPIASQPSVLTGLTLAVRVYTGSWVAVTLGTNIAVYPTPASDSLSNMFNLTSKDLLITLAPGTAWAKTTINSVSAFWLEVEITALTSITGTWTTVGDQKVYCPIDPVVEIPNTLIDGDALPKLLMRHYALFSGATFPNFATPSRIIVGFRGNANQTYWTPFLAPTQYGLKSSWARTLGTDAAEEADNRLPDGYRLAVSFATQSAMSYTRMTWTGANILTYYRGQYRAFLAVEQVGGAAGDLRLKLRAWLGAASDGNPYVDLPEQPYTQTKDAGYEILDMGTITLGFSEYGGQNESSNLSVLFTLHAQRVSGAATLRVAGLWLIPIDEFSYEVDDGARGGYGIGRVLVSKQLLDVDYGVLLDRTCKFIDNGSGTKIAGVAWHRSTSQVRILPSWKYWACALYGRYKTTVGTGPLMYEPASMTMFSLSLVDCWSDLIGNS